MRQGGRHKADHKSRITPLIARSAVGLGMMLAIPSPALAATPDTADAPAASFAVVRSADGHLEVVRQSATDRSAVALTSAARVDGDVLSAESDTVVTSLGTGADPL